MSGEESGVVRITQREVYDKVLAVDESVAKMTGLLETHIELTKQNQASTEARLGSVDMRLEAHGTRLSRHDAEILTQDGRIGAVETRLEEQRARKAPWWVVVSTITALIAGSGALITMLVTLSNVLNALANVG